MSQYVGIWLDQEKAYVVTIEKENIILKKPEKENVTVVKSDVGKHIRLSGGSRTRKTPYGPQDIATNGKIDAKRRKQLDEYYDKITRTVQGAEKILIFGPGIAKKEVEKKIKKSKELLSKVLPIETTDKMTERQILAKVKEHFMSYR